MHQKFLFFFLSFGATLFSNVLGQTSAEKAQLLFRVLQEITWPEAKNLEIGILDDRPMATIMQNWTNQYKIQERSFTVVYFRFNYQIEPVDVLFVSSNSSVNTFFDLIHRKMKGRKVLIVTETEGMIAEGSHINLLKKDARLQYQLNQRALQANGFIPSAKLIQEALPLQTQADPTPETEHKNIKEMLGLQQKNKGDSIANHKKKREKTSASDDGLAQNEPENALSSPKSGNNSSIRVLQKAAQEKTANEALINLLRNYIAALEAKLDANQIDYGKLKNQYETDKIQLESEILGLNLIIIEKDSLIAKDRLLAERKLKLSESEKALAQAKARHNFYFALLSGTIALGLLIASFIFYRDRLLIRHQRNDLALNLEEIKQQKEEIEAQKEEIERQNGLIQAKQAESEKLLLNILPAQTAEELKASGKATPQAYEMATVLFTDFKGFTEMAKDLSPEQLIQELNYCFTAFDEIVEKHGMERIKTIGDAYMCVGGVPRANSTNPIDAIKAGLEIQAFMAQLKIERQSQGKEYFECRLGINTGRLIAGVVGKRKFAYDIWGDTVNLASRMESNGEVGKVNISESTYQEVKEQFKCSPRGNIEVKGKGAVAMYFVEGSLA
ncbi:MAG: hypothetical protein OHK0053_29970 [Microscillaceae bacterium]